ncbi:MAG: lipid-binding SYLF domain-containing protein [Azospirillaceae bacterium]
MIPRPGPTPIDIDPIDSEPIDPDPIDTDRRRLIAVPLAAGVLAAAGGAFAQVSEQQALIDRAQITYRSMSVDRDMTHLGLYARSAEAILIVPELIRGGFFIGGAGGTGVLLARRSDLSWGYPAFYNLAGGSLGIQIGGQVSEVVLAIMTRSGLEAVQSRRVTLGADASVAAVTMGVGRSAATGLDLDSDMYAFSRNQGLFLGGALEGTVMTPREEWNRTYYRQGATANAILAGQFSNPGADALRQALPQ